MRQQHRVVTQERPSLIARDEIEQKVGDHIGAVKIFIGG